MMMTAVGGLAALSELDGVRLRLPSGQEVLRARP